MRTTRPPALVAAPLLLIMSIALAACASGASAPQIGGDDLAGGASAAPRAPDGQGETPGDGVGAPIDDSRIIRTGSMQLEVRDVPTALRTARDGIRAMGGYIGASETYDEVGRPFATITYRIPVDRWEDALDLLRGLNGQTTKVVAERTEAVEVTGAVLDLEARIANLRASETALQKIAADAVRVTDVLEVEARLTQVRGEIESLSAQLKDLEDRADFATLTVSFGVPDVAIVRATRDWDPVAIIDEASASLIELGQDLVGASIWFIIVWLPLLLVLAILFVILRWVLRRLGVAIPRRRGGDDAWPPRVDPPGHDATGGDQAT